MAQIRIGKLNIKKQPIIKYLAYFIFIMPFVMTFLIDIVRVPSFIKYTIDAVWLMSIALLFLRRKVVLDKNIIPFILFIIGFFCYALFIYVTNFQSVFYFLWGFRNNFRFYFAFLVFCMVFTDEDVDFCFKFMDVLFWINVVVTLFQFFVLGLKQDYLGGVFGVEKGCNGYSIAFFSIILSKSILQFMSKKESAISCFSKCIVVIVLSAMAELKFFFVIFAGILLLSTMLTSFSWRKFILILLSAFLFSVATTILTDLFGAGNDLSVKSIVSYVTKSNYSSENDLSRFTALSTLSNKIMNNNFERLFGFGLGNCDTSAFAICNTPFFETYSYLHYHWFSSALLFLETGYVGLAIYFLFFVMCFVFAFNHRKKEGYNTLCCQMTMIMSVICIALTFYNGSLRFEVAYMIYFVLSLPLINSRMIKSNSKLNMVRI